MTLAMPIEVVESSAVADLLHAAGRGDRHALDALVRRYAGFVHAAAMRQTNDRATADDVTQAVFLVLAKKADTVRPAALAAWLHQTTRYAAANANRAARRRRHHEHAAAKPESVMPTESIEPNPLLPLLDEAIAGLRDADRRVVVARYLLGQDVPTVAAELGLSPKTAQKRLDRAVGRLRHRLASTRSRTDSTAARVNAATITPAAVLAVLAASTPSFSPAATIALPAVPAAGAAGLAKSTLSVVAWTKAKAAATIVAATLAVGGTGVVATKVVQYFAAAPSATPPPPAPATVVATPPVRFAAVPPLPLGVRAELANGVSLEYIGVATNTFDAKPWYGPDGVPLVAPPYRLSPSSMGGRDGKIAREFAFTFDPQKLTVTPYADAMNAATVRFNSMRSVPSTFGTDSIEPTDETFRSRGVLAAVQAVPPGRPVTLAFDIAAGPWVPRLVSRSDVDQVIIAQNDVRAATLMRPYEDAGDASIDYRTAEFYSNPDRRFVAIDTGGGVHLVQGRSYDYRPGRERAAEPVMDTEIPGWRLVGARFGDIIDRLRTEEGLTIDVDWPGLNERMGVDENTTVTTRMVSEPLYQWLPFLFQDVRGDKGGNVTFDVKDGVVKIYAVDYRNRRPWYGYVPNLPLNRLARFEVQTREFDQWIAFDGLNPDLGKPARVSARTSDTQPPEPPVNTPGGGAGVTLANGTRVEVLALADNATGEIWRPDGTPTTLPVSTERYSSTDKYPGLRLISLVEVVRLPDGRYGEDRGKVLDAYKPEVNKPSGSVFSTMNTTEAGVKYRTAQFFVKADDDTLDWQSEVASKPPARASIERGIDGWNPKAVASAKIGDAGDLILWGPADRDSPIMPAKWKGSVRVWTPPSLGPDYDVNLQFVEVGGGSPNGWTSATTDKSGFRTAACDGSIEAIHRVTVSVTHYDQAATFKNISLRPGKKTAVSGSLSR